MGSYFFFHIKCVKQAYWCYWFCIIILVRKQQILYITSLRMIVYVHACLIVKRVLSFSFCKMNTHILKISGYGTCLFVHIIWVWIMMHQCSHVCTQIYPWQDIFKRWNVCLWRTISTLNFNRWEELWWWLTWVSSSVPFIYLLAIAGLSSDLIYWITTWRSSQKCENIGLVFQLQNVNTFISNSICVKRLIVQKVLDWSFASE